MQPVEIVAKERPPEAPTPGCETRPPDAAVGGARRDETGVAVEDFEVRLYRPRGSSPTAIGVDGVAVLTARELEVANRATWSSPGPSTPRWSSRRPDRGPADDRRDPAAGKLVRLHVRDVAGRPIPPDVMPMAQVYLERHRLWVRRLLQ